MPLPALVEPGAPLTGEEVQRYARHLLLPQVGEVGQRRLKNARVLVVGAGGLGSPAAVYLAAAGVGTLGVADADVGRPKTDSAAETLAAVNPLVQVVRHHVALRAGNAWEVLNGYDLVLDGTDNFPARYLLNDACALRGIPCVWGSVHRFDGQASVWWPAVGGPCYRCVFPEPPPAGSVPSCAEAGVLGALCGVVGSIQASEAVKVVTGLGEPLVGRLLVHDALRQVTDTLPVRRDPRCPLCGDRPTLTELLDEGAVCGMPGASPAPGDARSVEVSAGELAALLRSSGSGTDSGPAPAGGVAVPTLVDVRTPAERVTGGIPGALAVELADIRSGAGLARLPVGRPLVLYCASGVRSAEAASLLRAAGRSDVRSLGGGLLAWLSEGLGAQPAP